MRTFKFVSSRLQRRLLKGLERKPEAGYCLPGGDAIGYYPSSAVVIEEVINSVRKMAFPSWQILICPADWVETYRQHMVKNEIPFEVESHNGQIWFLIERRRRPHAWKLADPQGGY